MHFSQNRCFISNYLLYSIQISTILELRLSPIYSPTTVVCLFLRSNKLPTCEQREKLAEIPHFLRRCISKSVTTFTLFHLANTILNVCIRIKFPIEWCYIHVYGFSVYILVTSGLQRRNVLLFVFSRLIRHRYTMVRRHRNATSLSFFIKIWSNRYHTRHIIIPIWRGSFAVFGHVIYFYIVSVLTPHELPVSTYKTTRMLTSSLCLSSGVTAVTSAVSDPL